MRKALLALVTSGLLAAACGGGGAPAASHRSGQAASSPAAGQAGSPAPAQAGSAPAPAAGASAAPSPAGAGTIAAAPRYGARPAESPALTPVPAGTIVNSWNSPTYGDILVGGNGHVLYLYTPDVTSTPTCTGSCAAAWPPLKTTAGAPHAEGQADQSMLGVTDGQVTYNGHPLYYYGADSKADQTNGQGVAGVWYVVNTNGQANHTP